MKGAGLIYLLCGLLIVAAGMFGNTFGNGFALGAIALVIFGVAFLVMGRGLLLARPGARAYAIACSTLIVLGFSVDALWFVANVIPDARKFGMAPMFWRIVVPFIVIALVHAVALILLLRSTPPTSPAGRTPATPPSPRA